MEELKEILAKFIASGGDLIAVPSQAYLEGRIGADVLRAAIQEADDDCGSDGCELDPLYKRALAILAAGVEE